MAGPPENADTVGQKQPVAGAEGLDEDDEFEDFPVDGRLGERSTHQIIHFVPAHSVAERHTDPRRFEHILSSDRQRRE